MASYEADTKAKPPSDMATCSTDANQMESDSKPTPPSEEPVQIHKRQNVTHPYPKRHYKEIQVMPKRQRVTYSYRKQYVKKTHKKDEIYPMIHRPSGLGLVVTMTENRSGCQSDVSELAKLFLHLDVHTNFLLDLTKDQLENELKLFASNPSNDDVDCLYVILMGHGGKVEEMGDEHLNMEYLMMADRQKFFVQERFAAIFDNKKYPKLQGKPKVFIVQMCRGTTEYEEIDTSTRTTSRQTPQDATVVLPGNEQNIEESENIPRDAVQFTDYLFGFATQSGFESYRDTEGGAWYIQELTSVFFENAADSQVINMLESVNKRLQDKSRSQVGECVVSLEKPLFLFPGLQKKGKQPRFLEVSQRDPVLELSAAKNPEVQSAWRVFGLQQHGALITYGCEPVFKVMQVRSDGSRIGEDFVTKSDVNAVAVVVQNKLTRGGRVLYVESKGRISSRSPDGNEEQWMVDEVKSLWDADGLSKDEVVIVDSLKGEVFTYNLRDKKKVVERKGLDFPASISCFVKEKVTKFAVVEQGKHRVLVYNGGWKEKPCIIERKKERENEIKDVMNCPIYCQFLWNENLLICYRDSHQVSEFTCKGEFVRDWLTEDDGIKHPMSFSFTMPYLWVVHAPGQKNVSRFEMFWFDG